MASVAPVPLVLMLAMMACRAVSALTFWVRAYCLTPRSTPPLSCTVISIVPALICAAIAAELRLPIVRRANCHIVNR